MDYSLHTAQACSLIEPIQWFIVFLFVLHITLILDLLNCTEVRSVPSPTHPSAASDVGTIAAKEQSDLYVSFFRKSFSI